jgi:transketolase
VAAHVGRWSKTHCVARQEWETSLSEYVGKFPELGAELERCLAGRLPVGFKDSLAELVKPLFAAKKPMATRAASGLVINAAASILPELIGGSADLAPSNKTRIDSDSFMSSIFPAGRNIHFGVREHGMGAALNGLALHGGLIPYGGTFLVFSDFLRPAVRLSALMGLKVIYVLTHDSVGVGEDGPTHQPVEHIPALRVIPDLTVLRPADAHETAAAWVAALSLDGPSALILSRQNLPILSPEDYPAVLEGPGRGGYVLSEAEGGRPEAVILATGSEVHLALAAQALLKGKRAVRVVSMPSWELLARQDEEYLAQLLPPDVPRRLAVEAARSFGWERWIGPRGRVLSVETFGCSAPADRIFEELGFTPENVASLVEAMF